MRRVPAMVAAVLAVASAFFFYIGIFAPDPFMGLAIGSRFAINVSAGTMAINAVTFWLIANT